MAKLHTSSSDKRVHDIKEISYGTLVMVPGRTGVYLTINCEIGSDFTLVDLENGEQEIHDGPVIVLDTPVSLENVMEEALAYVGQMND